MEIIQEKFIQLKQNLKSYLENFDEDLINRAWIFAQEAHEFQKRKSGEKYITHPLEVALLLSSWKLDETTIIAGLLHDTVEDTKTSLAKIKESFGEDASQIVDGVTKITQIRFGGSSDEIYVENLRKMIVAMSKDLRVILVKLADRVHNMKTLEYLEKEKQIENAIETLEIYAHLAERLGMGEVKVQLEDLAFPYIYPDEYKKVTELSKPYLKESEELLQNMKKKILMEFHKEKIKAQINYRQKHLLSLWRKLERPGINWDFGKIYDIIAMRILVDSIEECYASLGAVHKLYKPVPFLGVSDFIAQPKPNGYQSIHTKVFSKGGRIVEVQIRTHKMHEEAEYGVAAHWAYSELKKNASKDDESIEAGVSVSKNKLYWVRQLVQWQEELKDSDEFLAAVKQDILKERIFVFSPNGDVFDLPEGATPVDFAYAVHTDFGNYLKSSKVNGKMVSLDHKLKNGDMVEILKSKNPRKPSEKWLSFVKTTIAKREIKKRE